MRRRQILILAASVVLAALAAAFSTFVLPTLSADLGNLLFFFFAALVAFYTVAQGVVAVDDHWRGRREQRGGREGETGEERQADMGAGPTARQPPIPFTLPPNLPTFTGREDLLEELDDLLHPGKETAVAIVGLRGMPGVGKSALAIHAAHLWQDRFPDGLIWVDLRGENAAYDALRRIASLYGYREMATEIGDNLPELADLARTVLRGRRALLILDNAEGLAADELACLLPGVPGPAAVVTSRRAFPALARLGRTLRVDLMDADEALDLFSRLLGREKVEADEEAHRDLAERLGHLPQALDIAARLMRRHKRWGAAETLRRLERAADRPAFLALPAAERPEDSVALAFALSYDTLDDADQELFRALSPFAPVGFTPMAVANVLDQAGQGEDEAEIEETVEAFGAELERVEAGLERLADLSLVRHAAPPMAFDLHPLLRDYARALAQRAGERTRWAERHASYYLALARHQRPRLGGPDYREALSEMEAAYPNVRVAWEAMLASEHWELVRGFAYALADYQDQRGAWKEMRAWAQAGLMVCERLDDLKGRAGMQVILGNAYGGLTTGNRADNLERAIEAFQAALQVYTRQDLPRDWAMTQNNLGAVYADRIRGDRANNLEQAIEAYQAALEVYTREDLPLDWAMTQNNLGNAFSERIRGDRADNLERAIEAFQAALQVRTRQDLPRDWATTQNNLGAAYAQRIRGDRADNLERAIESFQKVIALNPQDATACYNMACAHALTGDAGQACEWLQKAVELDEKYREMARHDADFHGIREDGRFKALVGNDEGQMTNDG